MDCCDLLLAGAIFNVHAMPNYVLLATACMVIRFGAY